MQEFVIMTKDCEKHILAVDDKRHISLFEEIGYRMTGRGFDEEMASLVEKSIQRSVVEWERVLMQKTDRVMNILTE